jgi:hypothetical protein
MGWFDRIFGGNKSEAPPADAPTGDAIPPERVGPEGTYDQSGLAKRVVKAFDDDAQLDDIETLWVAQLGTTVVLKGKVPSQDLLDKCVGIAEGVNGAASVDTSQVTVG